MSYVVCVCALAWAWAGRGGAGRIREIEAVGPEWRRDCNGSDFSHTMRLQPIRPGGTGSLALAHRVHCGQLQCPLLKQVPNYISNHALIKLLFADDRDMRTVPRYLYYPCASTPLADGWFTVCYKGIGVYQSFFLQRHFLNDMMYNNHVQLACRPATRCASKQGPLICFQLVL